MFATLFGLATSLGFGAQQANAGLDFVFGIPVSVNVQVILIIGITAVALISVLRGLDGGVKVLSEINMALAALLLLFVVIAGPTIGIITGFFSNLGFYFQEVIPLSNPIGRTDDAYRQGWTSFYWAWWISWSPFVGMFIARVSRGRTVREFIVCVLLIPSHRLGVLDDRLRRHRHRAGDHRSGDSQVKAYVIDSYSPELSLFGMLDRSAAGRRSPPASAMVLVIVFFVTSSD